MIDSAKAGRIVRSWRFLALAIPFSILVLLQLVNLLLQGGEYCALPTVLEGSVAGFPSPVLGWRFYAWCIVIIYAISLLIARIRRANANRARAYQEEFDAPLPSVWSVIAPFMYVVLAAALIGFGISMGEVSRGGFESLLLALIRGLNNYVIPFGLLVMLVMFLVGAYQYFVPGLDGNRLARRNGRVRMFVSFLFLVFVIIFWGVINLMTQSTGLDSASISTTPTVTVGNSMRLDSPLGAGRAIPENTLGFSVGGAKDADNFRENIEQCYLPVPTDITYEGLFYDYLFETANQTSCTNLFCPQYEAAVVPDPFSNEDEYFLSVGLGSNIDADMFARMPLDVVVVMDISGSMGSPFDRYYYDRNRAPGQLPLNADWRSSKMDIAKDALGAMVDRLQPGDRFGLVTFDSTADELVRIEPMGQNGYATAKNSIATLQPRGGTNMEAGLEEGTRAIKAFSPEEGVDRERRIIFLTDAMPNTGAIEQNDLYRIGQRNADEGIHTTFIGVGVDFNTELIEALTKEVRGANYFAIHSSEDFEKRLDIEFEYMVAPLVFDLSLEVLGGDYEIRAVYGSPESHLATGQILEVSTLFPSPTAEGNSRGGVILAHLEKVRNTGQPTRVVAGYTDRAGQRSIESAVVDWSTVSGASASPNVRKAVLLSRYTNLLQNWLIDENARLGMPEKTVYLPVAPRTFYTSGLVIPRERYPDNTGTEFVPYELNYWERLSRDLVVSEDYRQLFRDFRLHMEAEAEIVSETEKLQEEIELLHNLERSPDSGFETADSAGGMDSISRERL